MNAITIQPVAFDFEGAALASGVSFRTIQRATRAGDLPVHYPSVEGRDIAKPLILRDDLHEWVRRGASVRELT